MPRNQNSGRRLGLGGEAPADRGFSLHPRAGQHGHPAPSMISGGDRSLCRAQQSIEGIANNKIRVRRTPRLVHSRVVVVLGGGPWSIFDVRREGLPSRRLSPREAGGPDRRTPPCYCFPSTVGAASSSVAISRKLAPHGPRLFLRVRQRLARGRVFAGPAPSVAGGPRCGALGWRAGALGLGDCTRIPAVNLGAKSMFPRHLGHAASSAPTCGPIGGSSRSERA
jgi:hypothetical protein